MRRNIRQRKPGFIRKLNIPDIVWGVLLVLILFSILRPEKFPTVLNLMFIARNSAVLVIAAIGMTFAILTSQIDISIGSVMSLSGVVTANLIGAGVPVGISIIAAMAVGAAVGLLNGVLIAKYKFNFWIVTFSTMGVCAGLALVFSDSRTVLVGNDAFGWIGGGKIGSVYAMVYIALLFVIIMQLVLSKTAFGYKVYAIGGSEQNAALSGIAVVKNRILVYVLSGVFASIAGVILAAMSNSAMPASGAAYHFEAMAAVIIGGASFDGGRGSIVGTAFGVLLLRIVASGLNLLGMSASWQKVVIGVIIVAVIIANVLGEKRRKINDLRRRYNQ